MFPVANRSNREIGQGESRKRSGVRENPVCAPVDYLPASGVEQAWEVDAASSHVAADLRTSFDQYRRSAGTPGLKRGGNAGRSAADYQNVARLLCRKRRSAQAAPNDGELQATADGKCRRRNLEFLSREFHSTPRYPLMTFSARRMQASCSTRLMRWSQLRNAPVSFALTPRIIQKSALPCGRHCSRAHPSIIQRGNGPTKTRRSK